MGVMCKSTETKRKVLYGGGKEVEKGYYSFPCCAWRFMLGCEGSPFWPSYFILNEVFLFINFLQKISQTIDKTFIGFENVNLKSPVGTSLMPLYTCENKLLESILKFSFVMTLLWQLVTLLISATSVNFG